MGVLPLLAQVCIFPLFCRHTGDTFSVSHSGNCLCADIRALLLYGSVSGNLEMSPLPAIILQGRFSPKLIWGQMLLLRPSQMGHDGSGQLHFETTVPLRLADTTRILQKQNWLVICGAAKANENVCGDVFCFDAESRVDRLASVFDTNSFSRFVSWA